MDKQDSNRDVISFFSEAMGLDLGLEQAGLNIKICQDFDESCVKTIEANGKNAVLGDIRNIKPEDILNEIGLKQGEPFLVCGRPHWGACFFGKNSPHVLAKIRHHFLRIVKNAKKCYILLIKFIFRWENAVYKIH